LIDANDYKSRDQQRTQCIQIIFQNIEVKQTKTTAIHNGK